MRLRERDLKTVYIRPWSPKKDDEGCITDDYKESFGVKASIQPLSGQIAATEYGVKLQYMLQMKINNVKIVTINGKASIQGKNGVISEKDGVCVYVPQSEKPDYEVISIKPWVIPVIELQRVS